MVWTCNADQPCTVDPTTTNLKRRPYVLESDDLSDYLVSDTIIDWQTPAVRQKALELTSSLADEVDKARCLYE